MVKEYSYKKDKNKKLSEHFAVWEFRCKDGTDKILIDEELPKILEKLYKYLDKKYKIKSITIVSGYRTPEHSVKVGGYKTDQHTKGNAVDIYVKLKNGKKLSGKLICLALEELNHKGGVGYISTYNVHIDVRGKKVWFDETNNEKVVQSWYDYWNIKKEVIKEEVKEEKPVIEVPIVEPILEPVQEENVTPIENYITESTKEVETVQNEVKESKENLFLQLITKILELIFKGGKK